MTPYWYECEQKIKALEARIAELEALTTWQPIETAPEYKDIKLLLRDGNELVGYKACNGRCYDHDTVLLIATHWMPLPKPPEEK